MAEDTKNVKFHEEVQKMEYEPLDATELKLDVYKRQAGKNSPGWWIAPKW